MHRDKVFDVLIIGAGPIGLACGIEAKKRQLSSLIVEKGCLVNSIYHYPVNMTFFSTSEKIEIGGVPFVSHQDRPTRREALEYYRRVVQKWELDVHTYEEVKEFLPIAGGYEVHTRKGRYLARSIVIATGFYDHPNLLHIPGEDLPKVKHFYDDPHAYIGQKVVVVGAANSAIDAALETWRKGAEVTLVIRQPEISSRVKYWIRPDIENRIKEGSIKAYFQSELTGIREEEVDIRTPEGPVTLPNDWVLAMTGYHPNFSWLEKIGVCFTHDASRMPERDENTFETHLPGVFLAGTVCGGNQTSRWFIENSIEHAEIIMRGIFERMTE